jgi:hypothetical protein
MRFDGWKSRCCPGAVALAAFVGMWAASASAGRGTYDRFAYVPGGSSRPVAAAIQHLGYKRGVAAIRSDTAVQDEPKNEQPLIRAEILTRAEIGGRPLNPFTLARRFSKSAK